MTASDAQRGSIEDLQARLARRADQRTKAWWEAYLKGTAAFRGVAMGATRAEVRAWARETGFAELTAHERKRLAYRLLAEPLSEDKLAGVILLREHLLDAVGADDLPALASLFDAGHIADWNVCDWLCVRVLAALVRRDGRPVAERIAAWTAAGVLWRRRAAAVALAPLAPDGERAFAGFPELALGVCRANVRSDERFLQTSVGWLLRELSKAEPEAVTAFAAEHADRLSPEARRMALAKVEGRGRR